MSPRQVCACGCGQRAVHHHHAIYRQELRRAAVKTGAQSDRMKAVRRLERDTRNLVPLAWDCHGAHHNRQRPLPLRVLPDSVFEFASEVLGPGPAYEYLTRRYAGCDGRLATLLEPDAAATTRERRP